MKTKRTLLISLFSVSLAVTGFALAHGNGESSRSYQGHMGGMMGGAGMNFNQVMFDLEQVTNDLNLSNEQIAILSQLEASHIQMQSQYLDDGESFGHMKMMSMMDENYELMNNHLDLYQQFEATLSEDQQSLWAEVDSLCY